MSIFALCVVILLLTFFVEFFQVGTIFLCFFDAIINDILLEFSYYAIGYNGGYFGIL